MFRDSIPDASVEDRYVGVRTLWLKVIIRAVFDWVSYRDSFRLPQRKMAENAAGWLFEPSELFNSFENICYLIDISPLKIRTWARSISKEQIIKMEHLDRLVSVGPNTDCTLVALIGKNKDPEEF